jgi:LysR family positive regulator for ilvC
MRLQMVLDNEVDISVIMKPDEFPEQVDFLPIMETPLLFIAHKDLVLDNNNPLEDASLVLPASGLSRERTDHLLREMNISPNIYSQVNSNEAILALVNLGCGVGVVPRLVLEKSPFHSNLNIIKGRPGSGTLQCGPGCSKETYD